MSVAPVGGGSSTPTPAPPAARLPGYDGAAGPVSPTEQAKVDAAVGQIHRDLSDQGFIGHNRNDNMHDVVRTLNALTPAERDAVISKLSNSDLDAMAGNIDHGGIGGIQGLSSGEKKDLFNSFAGSLSGPQLARMSQAFHDPSESASLAQSVATFSTNATKAEFVAAMAGKLSDQTVGDTSTPFASGMTTSKLGDPDAKAVGVVLASMKGDGANFDKAVGSLSDSQLGAVIKSSSGQTMTTTTSMFSPGSASVSTSYDPKTLIGLIDAAATSRDPAVKGRIVSAGGREIAEIAGSNHLVSPNPTAAKDAQAVADSVSRVLDSDTTGVIRQMETNDRYGQGLTGYMQQELTQGAAGQAKIGQYVAALQTGNAHNQNPIARMGALENGHYRNAQDMGYLTGAIQSGVNKIATSNKEKADVIGGIFKTAVGLATEPAGKVGGAVIGVYTDQLVKEVTDEVLNSGSNSPSAMKDAFYKLGFPSDPKTHEPYEGPAEADYDSTVSRVLGY